MNSTIRKKIRATLKDVPTVGGPIKKNNPTKNKEKYLSK